jgi:hypothetical protein
MHVSLYSQGWPRRFTSLFLFARQISSHLNSSDDRRNLDGENMPLILG